MRINKRIAEHQSQLKTDKPILYILKGISHEELPDDESKLIGSRKSLTLDDLVRQEQSIIIEIAQSLGKNRDWYWATLAEINNMLPNLKAMFYTVLLDNNLYFYHYPIPENIHNSEEIYSLLEPEEEQLSEYQETVLDKFSKFYGFIDKINEKFYITFKPLSIEVDEELRFYDDTELLIPKVVEYDSTIDSIEVELSHEEDQMLALIEEVVNNKLTKNYIRIIITESIEKLPNKFPTRLALLNTLAPSTTIVFTNKEMGKKTIEKTQEYHDILKKYWGYDTFRNLKVYKDVQKGNETIEISQEQVIDDIVNQAEIALNGNTPRDIFVTASTGAGKSLMFQLPAMYLSNKYKNTKPLTIVISPLIGLMNDQVNSLFNNNISTSRTIHSGLTIFDREKIIEEIQAGIVDILYISTETLQNRSDIKMLIGDRAIGLFIVDEAHIVTTWGKSFRADYWYMGLYLQRLRKEYRFPIATFTATAIYGGPEDMYRDTIESLKLANPISYFGYVIRDDIEMRIESTTTAFEKADRDYRKTKGLITVKRVEQFIEKNQKTLIYFPTIKLLNGIYNTIEAQNPALAKLTGKYYGTLDIAEKDANYEAFKNGDKLVMLATKAFGMGIDIPDIRNVYHYAPTGNVVDYIQEIGRAARGIDKGYAWFDFLQHDFSYVKQLHGMSSISNSQILDVMRKIRELFKQKKSRNLVVSAEDFQYLVQNNENDENIDNRIKIILLMIEKDFERKIGYSPFVARPKQLFGNELIFVTDDHLRFYRKQNFMRYIKQVDLLSNSYYQAVYEVDLKKLWEEEYKNMSYPSFKYSVFNKVARKKLKHEKIIEQFVFCSGVTISADQPHQQIKANFDNYMSVFEKFLRENLISGKHFYQEDLAKFLQKELRISDYYRVMGIAETLITTILQFQKKITKKRGSYLTTRPHHAKTTYEVQTSYVNFFKEMSKPFYRLFTEQKNKGTTDSDEIIIYHIRPSFNDNNIYFETELLLLGVLESINSLSYEVVSGNSPQIYIRINSIDNIDRILNNSKKYYNELLNEVYLKHNISVELLTYLFQLEKHGNNEQEIIENYTNDFWSIIEDYFRGQIPEPVIEKVYFSHRK